jgi:hypothetical protein
VSDGFSLHPAWKQAEADLLADGLTYGSVISDKWLDAAMGVPKPATLHQAEAYMRARLTFRTHLFNSLLTNHMMMVNRVKSEGYVVVQPAQQTRIAMERRTAEMKHAITKMAREVSHVDVTQLTDAQRAENTNAQAKIGMLRSMVRKQLKLDAPPPP